jgi:hypothetical protein
MRANDSKSSGIGSVLLGVTALALAGTIGTIGLLQKVSELGPKVGDIVSFDPRESFSRDMKAEVTAIPVGARPGIACTLDVRTMHASGGSIIIEAREPQNQAGFRVHWAGGSSSTEGNDCGQSADLLLSREDLEVLAIAAGGFGAASRNLTNGTLRTSAAASK